MSVLRAWLYLCSLLPNARRILRRLLVIAGAFLLLMIALAFTRMPFDAHRWLGTAAGECRGETGLIVVLGGSGMPSAPELLRLHRTAELAHAWPDAALAIVHPGDPQAIEAMRDELILRGVDGTRILLINEGDNTRAQALAVGARGLPNVKAISTAIVTAPENMYRSVLTFRKAGFINACGAPAWEHAMFHEFNYDHGAVGGKAWAPDLSDQPALRYTFWNYLKLEVTCMREYMAIAYYWLNGWI
ncbi:MAG: YdcF family protein [Flavobacteriales bacterium]|nr:YdcF family protein [Flavobacteriales bacterium]